MSVYNVSGPTTSNLDEFSVKDVVVTALVMVDKMSKQHAFYAVVDGPTGCRILSAVHNRRGSTISKPGWDGPNSMRPACAYLEAMIETKLKEGWFKFWSLGDDVDYMPTTRRIMPAWWLQVLDRYPEYKRAMLSDNGLKDLVFKDSDYDYLADAPAVHRRRNKERKDREYAERTIAHHGRFIKVKTAR